VGIAHVSSSLLYQFQLKTPLRNSQQALLISVIFCPSHQDYVLGFPFRMHEATKPLRFLHPTPKKVRDLNDAFQL
jgi:hypothetical protein